MAKYKVVLIGYAEFDNPDYEAHDVWFCITHQVIVDVYEDHQYCDLSQSSVAITLPSAHELVYKALQGGVTFDHAEGVHE